MHLVHLEYMIRRGHKHLAALSQDHSLKHIYSLSDIGDLHTIIMIVEDVQVDSSNERVPQCVLLIQKARVCARLYIVPSTPFVNNERHLLLGIITIHNRGVLRYE